MTSMGVRELKAHISEALRRVREQGESIEVTVRGEVIARLVPALPNGQEPGDETAVWAELERVRDEISRHWPAGVSAVDAVREQRRDL